MNYYLNVTFFYVNLCLKHSVVRLNFKFHDTWIGLAKGRAMGNKPVTEKKKPTREEVLLKIVPPVDSAYIRWLARDLEMIHGYTVRNCSAVKPPDHYIEYMKLNGWLDVDMDDPDLAHLFRGK